MTTLAIDGSYALHRAKNVVLSQAKDIYKNALTDGLSEENASFKGIEAISIVAMTRTFFGILPHNLEKFYCTKAYVLWDEGRCHYRVAINPEYKVARNLKEKTFLDKTADKIFLRARQYLHSTLPSIGIASLLIPGIEADDFGYYLSHTLPSGVLLSDDQDWFLNLSANWSLCRPMQKGDNIYDWNRFTKDNIPSNLAFDRSPRDVYLYTKACVGDKDEIPRIATAVPAKNIALHMIGLKSNLTVKEHDIMMNSLEQIDKNLLLADTSWLIKHPDIEDMPKLLNDVNNSVITNNTENFWNFAMDTDSLQYSSRWKIISQRLNYST